MHPDVHNPTPATQTAGAFRASPLARSSRAHSRAVVWSVIASVLVHVAGVAGLIATTLSWRPRPARITDVSTDVDLLVSTPAPRVHQPAHDEPPPPPPPERQPDPATKPAPPPPERDEAMGAPVPPAPPQQAAPAPSLISDAKPAEAAPAPPPQPESTRASFAGVMATPARRIVYVIDASGSMASSLKFVKEELMRSVNRLSKEQEFQVIVFRQPVGSNAASLSYFAASSGRSVLTGASPEAKLKLAAWLPQVRPSGKSDILPALEGALAMNPDLVFLLSRSINRSVGFDASANNQRVLSALDRANAPDLSGKRPARIKTIQFLDDDPTGLMQEIARVHGDGEGSYRRIGRDEVVQGARDADAQNAQ